MIELDEPGQPFYAPSFRVTLLGPAPQNGGRPGSKKGGRPLPPEVVRDVIEVTYEDKINQVDSFSLVLNNWDAARLRPAYLGKDADPALWDLIQPGNELLLQMGYTGRKSDLRVMTTGYITALDAEFPETGAPRLTIRGLNVLDRLRGKQFTWGWPANRAEGITDSQIATDLARPPDNTAGRPGLGVAVRVDAQAAKLEPVMPSMMMVNEYPIVFLMRRARARGYEVFLGRAADGMPELYFGPSRRINDRTYRLVWGQSLVSAKAAVQTAKQVKSVTVLGWDRATKKQIKGECTIDQAQGIPAQVREFALRNGRDEVITDFPVRTNEMAKKHAEEVLQAQRLDQIVVDGAVVGLPDLRAGRSLELGGLGTVLNGRYFLTSTKHVLSEAGYRTTFSARLEHTT
ncbi:phage late control D family protein [Arthrobacter humicola]